MQYIPQIAFLVIVGIFGYFIFGRIRQISKNIKLGKSIDLSGNKADRWKNMLLIAFGQKKMFKRPLPAFLHLLIYVGFVLINLEVLEIIIDGIFGTHRIFAPVLGSIYTAMINFFEFLALGVLISCVVFLLRRNVAKVQRFHKVEMKGWPTLDANLILVIEIVLMAAILGMNAADQVLQERGIGHYTETGSFFISSTLFSFLQNLDSDLLVLVERGAWWGAYRRDFCFRTFRYLFKTLTYLHGIP